MNLNGFKSYFIYNRSERNGLVVLMTLMFLSIVAREVLLSYSKVPHVDQEKLDYFLERMNQAEHVRDSLHDVKDNPFAIEKINEKVILHKFDPNTCSLERWVEMGLSISLSKRILKYLRSGAKFNEPTDFKKVYGLAVEDYNRILPFIAIANKTEQEPIESNELDDDSIASIPTIRDQTKPETAIKMIAIDLNSADTTVLKSLKGIGSSFSKRIVKYRALLGGYRYKEQLNEVYGFTPEMYDEISGLVMIDTLNNTRLDINTCTFKELLMHPYCDMKTVKGITGYRAQHGPFQNVRQIILSDLVNEDIYSKLAPYLRVD